MILSFSEPLMSYMDAHGKSVKFEFKEGRRNTWQNQIRQKCTRGAAVSFWSNPGLDAQRLLNFARELPIVWIYGFQQLFGLSLRKVGILRAPPVANLSA